MPEHFRSENHRGKSSAADHAGKPDLSVVIASYNARATIGTCLDSLRAQKSSAIVEVILVDSSTDATVDLVAQNYPEVGVIISPIRLFCGSARNRGIRTARADIIAFLDADCYVRDDWVDSVLQAHKTQTWIVGGTIENGSPGDLTAWAYYFCEFSKWLPRKECREIGEVPGCCMSFKRAAYDSYGPFIEETYCSDTAFHWKLKQDNRKARQDPSIRVFHQTLYSIGDYLRHVAMHRRCYARVKIKERRLTRVARLGHIVVLPLVPFILLGTTGLQVLRSHNLLRHFFASLPLLFLGLCARAWGEMRGFASGEGKSEGSGRKRR